MHVIFPMHVVFPIAFLVGALVAELAFSRIDYPLRARAPEWLLGGAIIMGALAARAGLIEFVTSAAFARWPPTRFISLSTPHGSGVKLSQ